VTAPEASAVRGYGLTIMRAKAGRARRRRHRSTGVASLTPSNKVIDAFLV
jgi:hypothetical protein